MIASFLLMFPSLDSRKEKKNLYIGRLKLQELEQHEYHSMSDSDYSHVTSRYYKHHRI